MAIDPSCFAPDFEGRLKEFLDSLRNLAPVRFSFKRAGMVSLFSVVFR